MNNNPNINIENESGAAKAAGGENRKFRIVDLVAFILCFLISCSVWLFVISTENEEYEYTFTDVVVKFDGVSQLQNEHGLSIISEYETKVNITVKGYRSEIVKYVSDDFYAHVDVDSIRESGMHTLSVVTELPMGKMSIVSTSPSSVNILVDEIDTKKVPVKVTLRDFHIADALTLHDPIPEIDEVEVVGPKTRLDSISYAGVEYTLGNVTTSTNFSAAVKLYDDMGNEIDNPYIKPSVSEVLVKIKVTAERKIPLVIDYSAKDVGKYTYNLVYDPTGVTIVGDPMVIDRIENLHVDLGDLTTTTSGSFRVADRVELPSGIELADVDKLLEIRYHVERAEKSADNGEKS